MQNDSSQHTVGYLFDLLDAWSDDDYPKGVKPARKRIAGLAFFPGGCGLWTDPPEKPVPVTSELPVGKVMMLGHNFDSEESYNRSLDREYGVVNIGAWGGLKKLLPSWGIDLEDCFFTNAYMGLKADSAKSTGAFPGATDPDFVRRCQAFLLTQIQAQQPRLALTLGEKVLPVLAPLAPALTEKWFGARHLSDVDESNAALVNPVQFAGVPYPSVVVALTHPANRGPNVLRRRYDGREGDAAERALVREGISRSGLQSGAGDDD